MTKLILVFLLSFSLFAKEKKTQPKYKRKYFKHWNDADKDCRNKRAEVLKKRSLVEVSYRKSKRGFCTVKTGKWADFYYPEFHTSASKVDIDHVVPLKEAWISGAHEWDKKKREEFANDEENLVITYKKYNQSKGAQTPLTWAPANREYYCKYLNQWVKIKKKYELVINPKIYEYIKDAKCE
jgi:hypothetical protein